MHVWIQRFNIAKNRDLAERTARQTRNMVKLVEFLESLLVDYSVAVYSTDGHKPLENIGYMSAIINVFLPCFSLHTCIHLPNSMICRLGSMYKARLRHWDVA